MKESDTISVLICCHSMDDDHDSMLQQALESLARQTYDKFEVILVLDQCQPQTKWVAEAYKSVLDIHVHERPHKQGLAVAKNFGIKHCTGDWIAYLDADDEWMGCKLEVQRNFMLENSGVDFCFTEAWDSYGGSWQPNCFKIGQYETHAAIAAAIPRENVVCHGSAMIRKIAIDSLGGYRTDRSLLGREDWDLWQRAIAGGFTFYKVPERLYIYSMGTSVTRGEV
jgi:glycosyltransferase involved in cell wall biosynthesis